MTIQTDIEYLGAVEAPPAEPTSLVFGHDASDDDPTPDPELTPYVRAALLTQAQLGPPPTPDPNDPTPFKVYTSIFQEWTRNNLRAIAKADATTEPRTGLIKLRDTRTMTTADEDFVIGGGVLTRKAKLLLYAKSGAGKTTLLDHLAACLASGRPFLGRHEIDRPHRVLFVQAEMAQSEIASHGQDLLANFTATEAEDNLAFWPMTQLYLPEGLDLLYEAIREHNADILIADPFNRFFAGDNSTQPEQVNLLFRCLDAVNEDPDLNMEGVIVAHHMNVAGIRAAGSYTFEAWPSTILRLDEIAGLPTVRKLTYEKVRAPGSTLRGQSVRIELSDAGYLVQAGQEATTTFAGPFLVTQCLQEMAGQGYRDDLIKRISAKANCGSRTAATYLGAAVDQHLIRKVTRDAHGALYAVIEQEADDGS